MAVTGDGSAENPYVVTTYAELVEKAAESDKYIKIGNDINIMDEYPNDDMPTLDINGSYIDGDGKKIANWYKTTSGYCINWSSGSTSTIKNAKLLNIYITSVCSGFFYVNTHTVPPFENCMFSGILYNHFKVGEFIELKNCSMNLDLRKDVPMGTCTIADFNGLSFNNCYLKAKDTTATAERPIFPNFYAKPCTKDSYFDIETNAAYAVSYYRDGQGFDNSAFDIKTNKSWGWPNISGYSTSIFNGTSAPNVSATNAVKAVSDENWLDVSYLNGIGFNAG